MEEGTTPGGKPLKKSGTVRFGGWSRASGAAAAAAAAPAAAKPATDTRTTEQILADLHRNSKR